MTNDCTTIVKALKGASREAPMALLAVGDEGPGIAPEHRERIFHRFFRVDEARSRERGGTGLGLAIAKWAFDVHDGELTVESRPERGSEFRILLPAGPPRAELPPRKISSV